MKSNGQAPLRALHISALGLLATLASCGGGGSNSPTPSAGATPSNVGAVASLSSPDAGSFFWRTSTGSTVVLKDANGVQVPASSVTCAAQDAQQVQVKADCSQITALRLGTLNITVSGNGNTATLAVIGVPRRQWTGVHGAASSQGSGDYSFVTLSDGRLLGWGANPSGVLGLNQSDNVLAFQVSPTPVLNVSGSAPLATVAQGSAGYSTSLALSTEGLVWAWGSNTSYALGSKYVLNNSVLPVSVPDLTARQPLQHVVQLESGDLRAVALIDDGTVVTWGQWPGDNTVNSASLPTQVRAPDGISVLQDIVAVSAGTSVSLALDKSGQVYAWGYDLNEGRLGAGAVQSTPSAKSNLVVKADGSPLTDIVQISAGYNFSLALASDGTVWAWGSNAQGQLGSGVAQYTNVPYAIQIKASSSTSGPLTGISMVAAGGNHALALASDGSVYAWGFAVYGQLGDGPNRTAGNQSLLPRQVVSQTGAVALTKVVSVAAGYAHSLALLDNGQVLSWGDNFSSSLGRASIGGYDPTPAPVLGIGGAGTLSLAPIASYPNLLSRAR